MKNNELKVGEEILPLLRYDGVMMGVLHQFTELTPGPSRGATFTVKIANFSLGALEMKRNVKRAEFAGGLSA